MKKMLIFCLSVAIIGSGMLLFGDNNGKTATPLLDALKAKSVDATQIAKLLSTDTVNRVKERGPQGNTPLLVAVYRDLPEIAKMILDVPETERTARNHDGNTVMHIARTGRMGELLLKDEKIRELYNAKNRKDQIPLHLADTASLAKLILSKYSPDAAERAVNAVDDLGNTPIFYSRMPEFALFMQQHGAKLNTVNDDNQTPLSYVLKRESFEVTRIPGIVFTELLAEGNQKVETAPETRKEMALFFIDKSKDMKVNTYTGETVNYFDVTDNEGNTALHYVVLSDLSIPDQKLLIEKLIAAGEKKDIKNHNDETPLDIVKRLHKSGFEQLIPLLS